MKTSLLYAQYQNPLPASEEYICVSNKRVAKIPEGGREHRGGKSQKGWLNTAMGVHLK